MKLPAGAIPSCLLVVLVAVTPLPGSCEDRARMAGTMIQCYEPLTNATNGTESFRASLLPLLAALPSAAATTGFASLRSESDRAFVRGLCFGDATVPPSDCRGCLSVAARHLTAGCGTTTRRAGIWTQRCFLAYADSHASSPEEDTFRSRVLLRGGDDAVAEADAATYRSSYHLHAWLVENVAQPVVLSAAANISGERMLATADAATPADSTVRSTVKVMAQCARDRTFADCITCLQVSARAVDWDIDADRRQSGVAAAVLSFNCYLRFEVATALVPKKTGVILFIIVGVLVVVLVLAVILCALCLTSPNGKKKISRRLRKSRWVLVQRRQENI